MKTKETEFNLESKEKLFLIELLVKLTKIDFIPLDNKEVGLIKKIIKKLKEKK